jgi:hypothetical protein
VNPLWNQTQGPVGSGGGCGGGEGYVYGGERLLHFRSKSTVMQDSLTAAIV